MLKAVVGEGGIVKKLEYLYESFKISFKYLPIDLE
jgi:hypothetical protein